MGGPAESLYTKSEGLAVICRVIWARSERVILYNRKIMRTAKTCANSDAGESPKRKNTTFRTRRKFEIKKNVQHSRVPVICTGFPSTLVVTVYNNYDTQQSTTLRLNRILFLRCTVSNSICPTAAVWRNYHQLMAHSLHSHFTSQARCIRHMLLHVTLCDLRLAQRCCWRSRSSGM